jgi:plastocyanin
MATRRNCMAGALLAALTVSGCTLTSDPPPTSTSSMSEAELVVEVGDNEFTPDAVEVAVGDTVVWTFDPARRAHDVSFIDEPDRASGILDDGTWSTRFDEPGTHVYECTLHPGMDGQVVVTGS